MEGIWLGATELAQWGTYVWDAAGQPAGYTNLTMICGDLGKWNDDSCMTICVLNLM